MIGLAVFSYSMDEIMKTYGGTFFSIQIHWEVVSNLIFLGLSRNSKLFKIQLHAQLNAVFILLKCRLQMHGEACV